MAQPFGQQAQIPLQASPRCHAAAFLLSDILTRKIDRSTIYMLCIYMHSSIYDPYFVSSDCRLAGVWLGEASIHLHLPLRVSSQIIDVFACEPQIFLPGLSTSEYSTKELACLQPPAGQPLSTIFIQDSRYNPDNQLVVMAKPPCRPVTDALGKFWRRVCDWPRWQGTGGLFLRTRRPANADPAFHCNAV